MSMSAGPSISASASASAAKAPAALLPGRRLRLTIAGALGGCAPAIAFALAQTPAPYVAPAPLALEATTARIYDAPEADQGAAADGKYFYAVDNSVIAKYALKDGGRVAAWEGPAHGLIRHLNSCFAEKGRLYCANSNYSLTPMGSSAEIFDSATMTHAESHSLGLTEEGSLVWFDRYGGGWIAGFAHYDENGGLPYKDHRYSSVVTFDGEWRRTGGWLFPDSVLARMAPHAASGGAVGPDGLLYVMGHDRPEIYVLGKPVMGPTLIHVATIAVEAEGQAFSFAPGGARRVYAVSREGGKVIAIDLPKVDAAGFSDARPFR